MWTFMPGIYLRYPIGSKLNITADVLLGFTSTRTPTISVAVEDGGVEDGSFIQQSCTANAFGYSAAIGASYKLCSRFAVTLKANYLSCTPDFYMDNINRPVNVGRLVTEYNEPINVLSFSLGVAYMLGKK